MPSSPDECTATPRPNVSHTDAARIHGRIQQQAIRVVHHEAGHHFIQVDFEIPLTAGFKDLAHLHAATELDTLSEVSRDRIHSMGADIAVDPRTLSPFAPIPDLGNRQPNLVYECAGVPGLLQQIIQSVAFGARIVMGGYCMEAEQLFVFAAQNKRLTVHFAGGEEPVCIVKREFVNRGRAV